MASWAGGVTRRGGGRVPVGSRPRRARCGSCGVTHVLLPAWLLARRCDGTAVIGNMLTRAARALGVPEDGGRDEGAGGYGAGPAAPVLLVGGRVREFFTRLAGVLSPDPVPLNRAGSPVGGRGRGGRGGGGRGPRPVAGAHGVGLGAGRGCHGRVASVPVCLFRPRSRGCGPVCPSLTVQREYPLPRDGARLSLSVGPRGRAREGGRERRDRRDDIGRGG